MARAVAAQDVQLVVFRDLTGGVDLRSHPTTLPPYRLASCAGWEISQRGVITVMPGSTPWLTTSLGATPIQGAARIYLTGHDPFLLVAHTGQIYRPTDAGVPGTPVLTGLSPTAIVWFTFDQHLVAVCDGVSPNWKSIDGLTWTRFGIDAPATAPTLSLVAGGSLISGHTYEISYSYEATAPPHEGNEGPVATATTTATDRTIRATLARSTDPQVTTLAVYVRDVTAGETVRRRVGQVANPPSGTATFDVTGPASTWATGREAPHKQGVCPPARVMAVWKNRWWAVDADQPVRVRFSEIFQPQAFPELFTIDMPLPRGDHVVALAPLGDVLYVIGTTTIFAIIGQSPLDFEVRPALGAQEGACGPRAVTTIESGLVHAGSQGVFVFDGAVDRLISHEIQPAWRQFILQATEAQRARCAIVADAVAQQIRVAVSAVAPSNQPGEWIADMGRSRLLEDGQTAWTSVVRDVAGYVPWTGYERVAGVQDQILTWRATTGQLDRPVTDWASVSDGPVTAAFETAAISAAPFDARYLDVHGECSTGDGTLTIEVLVNGLSVSTQAVPLIYDGANRRSFVLTLPVMAEGSYVQLAVRYHGATRLQLFTLGLTLRRERAIRGIR